MTRESTSSRSPRSTEKRFYIENLGCAKNQVDAEVMISALEKAGYFPVSDPQDADIIVINTCGFIEEAKKESLDTLFTYRNQYPEKKLLLAGCFAQRYGTDLFPTLTEADAVFGNGDPSLVAEAVARLERGERFLSLPQAGCVEGSRERLLSTPGSAYVKIAGGCNHRGSYCAIPLIRGNLRSREREDIVREVRSLRSRGVFEFNLVAQDLAAFGTDRGKAEFSALLSDLSALSGDFWIRLLYIHPDNFPLDILDLMARDPRILPYFDIPLQHASRRILASMGRTGNRASYRSLFETIRGKLPGSVIRSTFLLGYPGEGKSDLRELESFLPEISCDWAGFFIYSREEGTAAYSLEGGFSRTLTRKAAEKAKPVLESIQENITIKGLERHVGRVLPVLIEENVVGEELSLGRSYIQAPEVDGLIVVHGGEHRPGSLVSCRIIKVNGVDLEARPVRES